MCRERGTFAGIFGVLIRFGLILAFSGTPIILHYLPVEWVFWIPAILLVVFFVLNLFLMENSPADAGLGEYDTGDGDAADGKPAALLDVLRKVFASRVAWTVAGASMMVGFVRRSVIDAWWPKYFADAYSCESEGVLFVRPLSGRVLGNRHQRLLEASRSGSVRSRLQVDAGGPSHRVGFCGMALLLTLIGVSHRLQLALTRLRRSSWRSRSS